MLFKSGGWLQHATDVNLLAYVGADVEYFVREMQAQCTDASFWRID